MHSRFAHPLPLPFLATGLIILIAVAIGYDGRRVFQLFTLALPGLAVLLLPVKSPSWRIFRNVFAWVWAMLFVGDGLAQAYFRFNYDAVPKSAMVLSALANTGERESREYLHMYAPLILSWSAGLLVAACALIFATSRSPASGLLPHSYGRRNMPLWLRVGTVTCVALVIGAYATPAWRKLHPVPFWSDWAAQVEKARSGLVDRIGARAKAFAHAQDLNPTLVDTRPSTIVLVISDSINRDNLGLYGYERDTTPGLAKRKAELGANKLVIQNAWATQASTVPALRDIFYFGEETSEKPLHILAMARAAGYRTWWISNHDDFAIDEMHARMADEVHMLSRQPGRITSTLDEIVVAPVETALKHEAPRKLIVVHLLGAHPHYSYRYPKGENPFLEMEDATDGELRARDLSIWVRRMREHYDAAIRYHDDVLSDLLDRTIDKADPGEYHAWFYLSDHGQEVGHEIDRAGHSAGTAAGFRIPTIVWQSAPRHALGEAVQTRPFRADWTGWTLMTLLGIRWNGYQATRDVLDENYDWLAPNISAPVTSFVDAPTQPKL